MWRDANIRRTKAFMVSTGVDDRNRTHSVLKLPGIYEVTTRGVVV